MSWGGGIDCDMSNMISNSIKQDSAEAQLSFAHAHSLGALGKPARQLVKSQHPEMIPAPLQDSCS